MSFCIYLRQYISSCNSTFLAESTAGSLATSQFVYFVCCATHRDLTRLTNQSVAHIWKRLLAAKYLQLNCRAFYFAQLITSATSMFIIRRRFYSFCFVTMQLRLANCYSFLNAFRIESSGGNRALQKQIEREKNRKTGIAVPSIFIIFYWYFLLDGSWAGASGARWKCDERRRTDD